MLAAPLRYERVVQLGVAILMRGHYQRRKDLKQSRFCDGQGRFNCCV